MVKAFGLFFNFEPEEYDKKIQSMIANREKGYSCVIDANVLALSHDDMEYRKIINDATINTCDGSSIASMASRIHKRDYKVYNGPEVFEKYIEMGYRHVILGNTEERFGQMMDKLKSKGIKNDVFHVQVPFKSVEEFDYPSIAKEINALNPDMVWISLGAPKQEKFISRIMPYIDHGVLFGIGAAVNFYIGEINNSQTTVGGLRFIWFQRLFKEPKKQFARCWKYVKLLPVLKREEKLEITKNGIIEKSVW